MFQFLIFFIVFKCCKKLGTLWRAKSKEHSTVLTYKDKLDLAAFSREVQSGAILSLDLFPEISQQTLVRSYQNFKLRLGGPNKVFEIFK